MTPYRRPDSPFYYLDLKLSDGRRLVRSTRATSKRRARQIEATIRDLDELGRHEILDALVDGDVSPRQVYGAKMAGRLDEIARDRDDPPLRDVVDRFERLEGTPEAKTALDKVRQVAPEDARVSWLRDPEKLRELLVFYRDNDYAAGTEQRQMMVVSKLLRHAFGDQVRSEVFRHLDLRDVNNRRCAWLTPEELQALREIASPRMWSIISTAVATGLRQGELLALRVRHVDREHGLVRVVEGKSPSARRKVQIAGEPLDTLTSWIEGRGRTERDLVWPDLTQQKIHYRWNRYREALDLKTEEGEWFRWHDLRHHYAVYMARAGVPLTELRDALGHSSLKQVERYAVYAPPPAHDRYRGVLRSMGLGAPAAADHQQIDRHRTRKPSEDAG